MSETELPPERVGQYTVGEKIGGGGQGIVYRAFDTRLERAVALKFLPSHLSRDPGAKERFTVEARAAASLDHPNICTIHEIGETERGPAGDEGRLFIVMPLYEGETVKEKLSLGPLDPGHALDIAIQTSRGLARAHAGGIVHRDVKPANLLVTSDRIVKILDFGIAKLTDLALTRTGMTLGTVAYMSPEQARGEAVDARTDLWSLGAVLYEMLTGQPPFGGGHEQAVLHQILYDSAVPANERNPRVPDAVAAIASRALEKEPSDRYASAAAMLRDLEKAAGGAGYPSVGGALSRRTGVAGLVAVATVAIVLGGLGIRAWSGSAPATSGEPEAGSVPAASPAEVRRLAVLPFTNLRQDQESDYLGYAVADQVIGALNNFQNLAVRPSSQVRRYAGLQVDPLAIGAELDVDYVLTGGFLKVDEDIRLNIELLDVGSDALIWRQDLSVAFENAFVLQDMVADSVIRGLEVQFSDAERARLEVDVPASPLAYEYFLRARAHPNVPAGNQLALDLVDQSLAIDSMFAPAHVERGRRHYWLGSHQLHDVQEQIEAAEASITRALELNPDQLDALWLLVIIYQETARGSQAYPLVRRMLEINPKSTEAYQALSYLYRQAGLLDEAARAGDRAVALDPGSVNARVMAGIAYYYVGRYDLALDAFAADLGIPFTEWWMGRTHFAAGRPDSTVHYMDRTLALDSTGFFGSSATSMKALIAGDTAGALAVYRARQDTEQTDGEVWYVDAQEGALLGDSEAALGALRNAVRWGFFSYPLIESDPLLQGIRAEPEFHAILDEAREKHGAFRQLVEGG